MVMVSPLVNGVIAPVNVAGELGEAVVDDDVRVTLAGVLGQVINISAMTGFVGSLICATTVCCSESVTDILHVFDPDTQLACCCPIDSWILSPLGIPLALAVTVTA